jgi:mono/diheme cytochrome c family protein
MTAGLKEVMVIISIIYLYSSVTLASDAAESIERGAYLTAAAGCLSCHTDTENDGTAFAGGHQLETPFGLFSTPNITPDMTTGIGSWSQAEFIAALREGISPAGEHYYPAFPYASYAGITDQDAQDIYAHLQSLSPVTQANQPHELKWYVPGRWAIRIWNSLFAPWDYPEPTPTSDAVWARGAYLVRHLGHCGECHTPRNLFGALKLRQELQGSPKDSSGRSAPNITPDGNTGIGTWSEDELLFFLEMGMLPDGDFVGSSMTAVIDENTGTLTPADRQAIAVYLQSNQ